MPQIESWLRLPAAIRDHLVERMRDRNINLEDLNRLRIWIDLKPNVPEGAWFKDFGSFKLCGKVSFPRHSCCQGQFPKTFLLRGQRWHEESHCEAEAKTLHP
jgi:hypothetical protein